MALTSQKILDNIIADLKSNINNDLKNVEADILKQFTSELSNAGLTNLKNFGLNNPTLEDLGELDFNTIKNFLNQNGATKKSTDVYIKNVIAKKNFALQQIQNFADISYNYIDEIDNKIKSGINTKYDLLVLENLAKNAATDIKREKKLIKNRLLPACMKPVFIASFYQLTIYLHKKWIDVARFFHDLKLEVFFKNYTKIAKDEESVSDVLSKDHAEKIRGTKTDRDFLVNYKDYYMSSICQELDNIRNIKLKY